MVLLAVRFGCSVQTPGIVRHKEVKAREIAYGWSFSVTMVQSKAFVHVHASMAEPRPFFQIEARSHNGSVAISIPRSFRGQLTLQTHNGRVHLSSALAPHAAMLSGLNGAHTYFVGERPSNDKWRTGASGEGEEVDEAIGSSKNGAVKVSYDDEDAGVRIPGVLSSLFRAMGF